MHEDLPPPLSLPVLRHYVAAVACTGPGRYLRRATDVTSTDHDSPSQAVPRPRLLPGRRRGKVLQWTGLRRGGNADRGRGGPCPALMGEPRAEVVAAWSGTWAWLWTWEAETLA